MSSLFDPEARLWRGVARFTDLLTLSLLWLFFSLPLFTLGAATAALYDAAVKCVRTGRSGAVMQFWRTFRREFKTATLVTLLWGGLCAGLIWLVWTIRANVVFEGPVAAVVLALWFLVLLIPVGALCWMFPLLSRFTFTARALISTALRFTLGFLPQTALISVSATAAVILSGWLLLPMLILPCLTALFWSLPMERIFRRYHPEQHPEA